MSIHLGSSEISFFRKSQSLWFAKKQAQLIDAKQYCKWPNYTSKNDAFKSKCQILKQWYNMKHNLSKKMFFWPHPEFCLKWVQIMILILSKLELRPYYVFCTLWFKNKVFYENNKLPFNNEWFFCKLGNNSKYLNLSYTNESEGMIGTKLEKVHTTPRVPCKWPIFPVWFHTKKPQQALFYSESEHKF